MINQIFANFSILLVYSSYQVFNEIYIILGSQRPVTMKIRSYPTFSPIRLVRTGWPDTCTVSLFKHFDKIIQFIFCELCQRSKSYLPVKVKFEGRNSNIIEKMRLPFKSRHPLEAKHLLHSTFLGSAAPTDTALIRCIANDHVQNMIADWVITTPFSTLSNWVSLCVFWFLDPNSCCNYFQAIYSLTVTITSFTFNSQKTFIIFFRN